MSQNAARRLRPYLFHGFKRSQSPRLCRSFAGSKVVSQQSKASKDVTHDYEKRLDQLEAYKSRDQWYPRISANAQAGRVSVADFRKEYEHLEKDQTESDLRTVIGMSAQDEAHASIAHSHVRRQSEISPHRRLQARLP